MSQHRSYVQFVAGIIVSSVSTTLGLMRSFQGDFTLTSLGMIGVVLGFLITQNSFDSSRLLDHASPRNYFLIVAGSFVMAYGFTLITGGIRIYQMPLGGMMTITGFWVVHEGVNDSVF